jgi:predicted O-methyltransferase YrrM
MEIVTTKMKRILAAYAVFAFMILFPALISAEETRQEDKAIKTNHEKVQSFLESRRGTWRDMNVPESDGKILYDLILKNRYKRALEIGTSTGHSGIWLAWALSQTGGKLITIEIDEGRYRQALANFEEAGLSEYIDARRADAHALVKELEGPFDFVFCDADKGWYKNYFLDIYPKLEVGGCYTAHNISGKRWKGWTARGAQEFYEYVKSLKNMETFLDDSGAGVSISFKRTE